MSTTGYAYALFSALVYLYDEVGRFMQVPEKFVTFFNLDYANNLNRAIGAGMLCG
jgi:hypothetical protein